MRFKIVIYLSVCILGLSCSRNVEQEYLDKEINAINSVLHFLIDIDYHHKPALPLELVTRDSFPEIRVKQKEIEYSKMLADYYKRLEVLDKELYLNNTLSSFDFAFLPDSLQMIAKDESFISNLSIVNSPVKLPISSIKRTNDINILNSDYNLNKDLYNSFGEVNDTLRIGIMSISRILFDSDYNRGIFFVSLASSATSSRTKCVTIEFDETSNKWQIKHQIILEVS